MTINLPTDRLPTEHEEQRDFVRWMRMNHPNHWVLAIPNGGKRSRITAQKLKAEGVSAGVPDLFIPSLGLWIEMKRQKGGSISADQKKWISYLQDHGFHAHVARGSFSAREIVLSVLAGS